MDLKDKKLLLMGGGAYAKDILKYKEKMSFKIVALGRDADTPIAKISDVFYKIDTQDVDAVCEVVKDEGIAGIFVGSSEVNIAPAICVSEKTGVNFYTNFEQWEVLANKAKFKEVCRKSGVPVVPEFDIKPGYTREMVENLNFPVLLKPTDSSGARGMNACYKADDFDEFYNEALNYQFHFLLYLALS